MARGRAENLPARCVPSSVDECRLQKNICVRTHNSMKYLFSLATNFFNCLLCIFIKYFELYLENYLVNLRKKGFELCHRHGSYRAGILLARWIRPVAMDT